MSRPKILILFGSLFLLLPVINYFIISYQLRIHFAFPVLVFSNLKPLQIVLLFAPVIVGLGLFSVEKWGYFVFLGYSGILILHNLVIFIQNPLIYNLGAILQTVIGTSAIL
ncbi:MAG: hypothetical protein K8R21_12535, partial [Leptospira sp.]|nr:hypothetical protein [Leptospira sp.]